MEIKMKNMLLIIAMVGILIPNAFAILKLDDVQFDPAIVAAGDEVDVVVQYHDDFRNEDYKEGNPEYKFKVSIRPDDTLSKEYITLVDSDGELDGDIIFQGKYYNEIFKVKINQNAPAGNYRMNLVGQWYRNGKPDGSEISLDFYIPVKREGIVLDIANIVTLPSEVRPGDNFVKLNAYVENVGQKDAKSVEVELELPEGIESSYTNNNRVWVGRVNAGENKEVTFFVDVSEDISSGVYDLKYSFEYLDIEDNRYTKISDLPFLIKSRPDLEIVKSEGVVKAGEEGELKVYIKNTGEESAEAVDVRLLLQNSQPFSLDVRSDYIGELEPGETGTAVFAIKANSDATEKIHNFKVSIRSKGDSDEGDDNIYTYSRRAELKVSGKSTNWLLYVGVGALVIIGIVFVMRKKAK